jgi:hypothetical protein
MKFIKRKNIDTYKPKSQRFTVEVDGRAIIDTTNSLTVPIGNEPNRPTNAVPGMIRYNTEIKDFEVFTDYSNWGWERLRTNRPADININDIGRGDGDGTVASIQVIDGGSGYDELDLPTITIDDPDVGNDTATVDTVTIVDGVITAVTIDNTGSGYITVPKIFINGAETQTLKVVLTGTLLYELPIIPVDSFGNLSETNIQVYVENVFQLPGINYEVELGISNDPLLEGATVGFVRFDAPVPYGKPIYVIYGYDR